MNTKSLERTVTQAVDQVFDAHDGILSISGGVFTLRLFRPHLGFSRYPDIVSKARPTFQSLTGGAELFAKADGPDAVFNL
jgi:hypothetical protein